MSPWFVGKLGVGQEAIPELVGYTVVNGGYGNPKYTIGMPQGVGVEPGDLGVVVIIGGWLSGSQGAINDARVTIVDNHQVGGRNSPVGVFTVEDDTEVLDIAISGGYNATGQFCNAVVSVWRDPAGKKLRWDGRAASIATGGQDGQLPGLVGATKAGGLCLFRVSSGTGGAYPRDWGRTQIWERKVLVGDAYIPHDYARTKQKTIAAQTTPMQVTDEYWTATTIGLKPA